MLYDKEPNKLPFKWMSSENRRLLSFFYPLWVGNILVAAPLAAASSNNDDTKTDYMHIL